MKITYWTEEDQKKQDKETISNLTEEQKSEFVFNGEPLYDTKERGHDFVFGWFTSYITKSGIHAIQYFEGYWRIGGDGIIGNEYDYVDGEFIQRPNPEPSKPIDWDNFTFPLVKNVVAKTIADDLKPHYPNPGPEND